MILVFGSLNADLVFSVPRLPRGGETVLTARHTVGAGGKGANQAAAAARSGAVTRMAGCVGRDQFGDLLVESLADAGVSTEGVLRVDAPTGCAAIGVDPNGENQIMVAGGANLLARADMVEDSWLIPRTTLLLQMEVEADQNWRLARRAKARGARVILNLAPAADLPEDAARFIDILMVNEVEAAFLAGRTAEVGDPEGLARAIAGRWSPCCVLTLGGKGALAVSPDGCWITEALPITPVDTTGAGDTFCGVLAGALDDGKGMAEALRRAGVAGALSCLKAGAQAGMPTRQEIDAHLDRLVVHEG